MVRLLDLAQPPKVDPCVSPEGQGWGWLVGAIPDEIEAQVGTGPVSSVLPYPLSRPLGLAATHPLCQDLTSALPTPFPTLPPAQLISKASN